MLEPRPSRRCTDLSLTPVPQELIGFNFKNKLLVTGTPLQNSLRELWALLHFLQQDKFPDSDVFEQEYSLQTMDGVSGLHSVLRWARGRGAGAGRAGAHGAEFGGAAGGNGEKLEGPGGAQGQEGQRQMGRKGGA